jgi:hypothetical protein
MKTILEIGLRRFLFLFNATNIQALRWDVQEFVKKKLKKILTVGCGKPVDFSQEIENQSFLSLQAFL